MIQTRSHHASILLIYCNQINLYINFYINSNDEIYCLNEISEQPLKNNAIYNLLELDSFIIQAKDDQLNDSLFCNCQKTGCLKLYCSCFRRGVTCGQQCQCNSCHNCEGDQKLIIAKNRVSSQLNRDLINDNFIGCKCVRSKCKQKYCECLIRGMDCSDLCKCKKCQNGKCIVPNKKVKRQKQEILQAIQETV